MMWISFIVTAGTSEIIKKTIYRRLYEIVELFNHIITINGVVGYKLVIIWGWYDVWSIDIDIGTKLGNYYSQDDFERK